MEKSTSCAHVLKHVLVLKEQDEVDDPERGQWHFAFKSEKVVSNTKQMRSDLSVRHEAHLFLCLLNC